MTKADIAKELYEKNYNWLSRKEASDMVELLIGSLKENLADGKIVKIAGFGTFIVRKKAERKGRNLKTGEEIPIAPRKVVTFKASNQFKAMVEKVSL
jgi:integration host factor subunit alpha